MTIKDKGPDRWHGEAPNEATIAGNGTTVGAVRIVTSDLEWRSRYGWYSLSNKSASGRAARRALAKMARRAKR